MKNAALYLRVSTESQDFERQKDELMNLATNDGCKVCFVFCEKISGMNNERPEFLRLQKLTKNDIDVIYVWEISRLSRKAYKMLEVCEEFANKGICIISKKENIRTLDDGKWNVLARMSLGLFASMAQNEVETLKERMMSGKRNKLKNGTMCYTAVAPYGYRQVDKKLVIDKTEADIVRKIFDMYLDGYSIMELTDLLVFRRFLQQYLDIKK